MSRWQPLTAEEARDRRTESTRKYRASEYGKIKEKERRIRYLTDEAVREKRRVAAKALYHRKMSTMTPAEREEWNARKRDYESRRRSILGADEYDKKKSLVSRKAHLRARYKMSVDDFERKAKIGCMAKVLKAPGDCAGGLCVDHDHLCCPGHKTCGRCVRFLLCAYHNARLGAYEKHRRWSEFYLEMVVVRKENAS